MTDTNDYKILSIYIVFGFLIMVGYVKMAKDNWNDSSNIWTNKGRNLIGKYKSIKYAYIVMIFLSFIAGPYLIYYLTTTQKGDTDEVLIYTGSVVLLVCSTVWAFFPFECPKIILGAVAVGSILILSGISVNSEDPKNIKKIMALLASSIIVFQTSIFDFGIWNGILKF